MPLTNNDAIRFKEVLAGTRPLRAGISTKYAPPGAPAPGAPFTASLNPHLGLAHTLSSYRKHAEELSNRLQGDEIGLLTTPEYFFGDLSNAGEHLPYDRKQIKKYLKKLSIDYPNVILNPAGFYRTSVDENNPVKRQKFINQMGDFRNKINNGGGPAAIPPLNSVIYPTVGNDLLAFANAAYDPLVNESIYGSSPKTPAAVLNDAGPWNKIKNQSDYFFKGEKIGSYKKNSYFNELSPKVFTNLDRGYVPGQPNIKAYPTKDAHGNIVPDDPKTVISNLLSQYVTNQICYDNVVYPSNQAGKKIAILQSESVAVPENYDVPFGIYADQSGLNFFDELNNDFGNISGISDPTKYNFYTDPVTGNTEPSNLIPLYNILNNRTGILPVGATPDFHPGSTFDAATNTYAPHLLDNQPKYNDLSGPMTTLNAALAPPTMQFFGFQPVTLPRDNALIPHVPIGPGGAIGPMLPPPPPPGGGVGPIHHGPKAPPLHHPYAKGPPHVP